MVTKQRLQEIISQTRHLIVLIDFDLKDNEGKIQHILDNPPKNADARISSIRNKSARLEAKKKKLSKKIDRARTKLKTLKH